MSSVQLPSPVSLSGEILGAYKCILSVPKRSLWPPNLSVMGGCPGWFLSAAAWQWKYLSTPFTRYYPRCNLYGDDVKVTLGKGLAYFEISTGLTILFFFGCWHWIIKIITERIIAVIIICLRIVAGFIKKDSIGSL